MAFFDFLTGADQRRDISSANKRSNRLLAEGAAQQGQYFDQAADLYNPYVSQGANANAFYNDALGLNGDEARSTAVNTLASNPLFQGQLATDSNAIARQLNARGQSGGGLANIAAQRVFQGNALNFLDRYRDAGQQGLQATGALSGVRQAQGDNAYGYAATRAGNAINYGNALAQTRTTGINNLTNLLGTGLKAFTAFK